MIAELKRRSPSRGVLNDSIDAASQARAFERGGAAAISVLTEPTRFGGSLRDLKECAEATRLPLLRKDFHIASEQLDEAVEGRASAVLLIARALPPAALSALASAARARGLEPVVEVRTEHELGIALECGARIVGVNSRDLETLEVDERVPARLIPLVPRHVVAVWESGVRTVEDVRRAAEAGADAVLVGSALTEAPDAAELLRTLTTVSRAGRRG